MEIESPKIEGRSIAAKSGSDEAVALLKQLKADRLQFKALVFVLLTLPVSWASIPFIKVDFAGGSLLSFYLEIATVNLVCLMIVRAGFIRRKYSKLTSSFFIVSYIAAQLAVFQLAMNDVTFRLLPAWLAICFVSWLMFLFPCGIIFTIAKLSKVLWTFEGPFLQRLRRELYLLMSNKENEVMIGFAWTGFVWLFIVGVTIGSMHLEHLIRSVASMN